MNKYIWLLALLASGYLTTGSERTSQTESPVRMTSTSTFLSKDSTQIISWCYTSLSSEEVLNSAVKDLLTGEITIRSTKCATETATSDNTISTPPNVSNFLISEIKKFEKNQQETCFKK